VQSPEKQEITGEGLYLIWERTVVGLFTGNHITAQNQSHLIAIALA
jgi:hypothetical protein